MNKEPLEEQPGGVRWVKASTQPWSYEEHVSFKQDSSYDLNIIGRAKAIIDRAMGMSGLNDFPARLGDYVAVERRGVPGKEWQWTKLPAFRPLNKLCVRVWFEEAEEDADKKKPASLPEDEMKPVKQAAVSKSRKTSKTSKSRKTKSAPKRASATPAVQESENAEVPPPNLN